MKRTSPKRATSQSLAASPIKILSSHNSSINLDSGHMASLDHEMRDLELKVPACNLRLNRNRKA
jgi:hypothetical protein